MEGTMRTSYVTISAVKVEKHGGIIRAKENGDVEIEFPSQDIQTKLIIEVLEEANFTPADVDTVLSTIHETVMFSALKKFIR